MATDIEAAIARGVQASKGGHEPAVAEHVIAALDEAGYAIRKKPATRKPAAPVEPFAPNTGDPAVDEFMRKHHDPKRKLVPLPKAPGLPNLRPMKVSEQDAAERDWRAEAEAARRMVAEGKRPQAEVELRTLIALHRSPWTVKSVVTEGRGGSAYWGTRGAVTTYRSARHPGIEIQRVRRPVEPDIWRVVVDGVPVGADHYSGRFTEEAADAALEARRA